MMHLSFFMLREPFPPDLTERILRKVSPARREIYRRQNGREHALMRLLPAFYTRAFLSGALGIPNRDLQFYLTSEQKPGLCGDAMYFNFSHTGDAFAFACGEEPVGVDLEKPRPMRPNLIARYYSEAEKAQIRAGTDPVRIWTRKEAMLKLRGEGLAGIETADTAAARDVCFECRKIEGHFLTAAAFSQGRWEFEILTAEKLRSAAERLDDLPEQKAPLYRA